MYKSYFASTISWILLFLLLLLINIVSSSCSYGFLTFNAIRSRLRSSPVNDQIRLLDSELRIMPEMSFTCNGTIKGIYLSGRINGCCGDYPQLLIWEPAKGSNSTFDLVSATPIEIVRISRHGYFYYEFETPLSFYENNVLGMYQPSEDDGFQVAYNSSVSDAPISYTCPLKSGDPVSQKIDITDTRIVQPRNSDLLLMSPVTSVECLQNVPDLYKVKNTRIGNTITLGNHSIIFPNIVFKCDGYITHWFHGLVSQQPSNISDSVQVQIWRPIIQDNLGDGGRGYRLINSTPISVSIRSDSNIIIRQLSRTTIRPPLQVMKDDIVGIYQPSVTRSELLYNEFGGPDNLHFQQEGAIVNEANLKATCSDHYPLLSARFVTALPTSTVTISSSTTKATATSSKSLSSSVGPASTRIPDGASDGMSLMIIIILSCVIGGILTLLIISLLVLVFVLRNKREAKNTGSTLPPSVPNAGVSNGKRESSDLASNCYAPTQVPSPAPYVNPVTTVAPPLLNPIPHSSSISEDSSLSSSGPVSLSSNVSYSPAARPIPVLPNISYATTGNSPRGVKPAIPVKPNTAYKKPTSTQQPVRPVLPVKPNTIGAGGSRIKPIVPLKPNVSYNARGTAIPVQPNISYREVELESSCEYSYV
ncbi:PREDICTED: uncharacterized protein LOC109582451 [Amphimedon queenslandica]|uniref:Uncharacterized protein n=1 Tax=Amphimedon queenslandica TaxID=400682 RepID=A0A1X7VSJ6_AMPQE|nr:PREDICTED: uncharacterized protein LOC109582451 [Amphimedon queenslandica]|eukprot:XP_019852728.1 PREDICTED: uncharacterized protein LOC109582451 [Amphimedon queenslandica]